MTARIKARLATVPCGFCAGPVVQGGAVRGRYRDAHPECSEIASSLRRLAKALDAGVAGAPHERQVELVKLVRSNVLAHLCSTFNAIKPNGSTKKRPKPPEKAP